MEKRISPKIGDVFCAYVNNAKYFFQYIGRDKTLKNLPIIRAFHKVYLITSDPTIEEIVSGDVFFYAHMSFKSQYYLERECRIIGNSKNLGLDQLRRVVWGAPEYYVEPGKGFEEDLSPRWKIWWTNEPMISVGRLQKEIYTHLELGFEMEDNYVLERLINGFPMSLWINFNVPVVCVPRPKMHAFVRLQTGDTKRIIHFYDGRAVHELIFRDYKATVLTADQPSANGYTLWETPFSDTMWRHFDFISREDFKNTWKEFSDIPIDDDQVKKSRLFSHKKSTPK